VVAVAGPIGAGVSRRAERGCEAFASAWRLHSAANTCLSPLEASAVAAVRLREWGNGWPSGAEAEVGRSERGRSMRRRRSGVESGVDGSTSAAVERSSRTSSAIAADRTCSGAGPRADLDGLEFCSCVAAVEVELSN
jgi:hypothetical protein